jgi:type IV pilus assembly protein PilO
MSPQELEQESGRLRAHLRDRNAEIERLRTVVEKVERARQEGDAFMQQYFLDRRNEASTILTELRDAAEAASLKQGIHNFQSEAVEGSENLSMLTISGDYEGSYANLLRFLNLLDRSPRFLILDTLAAAPQRTAGTLNVNLTIHVFVLDSPGRPPGPAAESESDTGDTEELSPADVAGICVPQSSGERLAA